MFNLPGIFFKSCDSGAIRTLDPRLRRALLYPAELRNHPYLRCKGSNIILTSKYFCYFFLLNSYVVELHKEGNKIRTDIPPQNATRSYCQSSDAG